MIYNFTQLKTQAKDVEEWLRLVDHHQDNFENLVNLTKECIKKGKLSAKP